MTNKTIEIARETMREMKSSPLVRSLKEGLVHTGETLGTFYARPTTNRRLDERYAHKFEREAKNIAGISWGIAYSLAGTAFYGPAVLAIPLATNAASWIYENARKAKQNLEVNSK